MSYTEFKPDDTYYKRLRYLRDTALANSYVRGSTHRLSIVRWGVLQAEWGAEQHGTAKLRDRGLRINGKPYGEPYPSELRLENFASRSKNVGKYTLELVRFRLDIDRPREEDVRVYRTGYTAASVVTDAANLIRTRAGGYAHGDDGVHDLTVPTEEDYELLLFEMERGASGLYAVTQNKA